MQAGRDGKPSLCRIYYRSGDEGKIRGLIKTSRKFSYASKDQVKRQEENLELMAEYCKNSEKCRRNVLLEHFGEIPSLERMCDKEGSELCDICRRRKRK